MPSGSKSTRSGSSTQTTGNTSKPLQASSSSSFSASSTGQKRLKKSRGSNSSVGTTRTSNSTATTNSATTIVSKKSKAGLVVVDQLSIKPPSGISHSISEASRCIFDDGKWGKNGGGSSGGQETLKTGNEGNNEVYFSKSTGNGFFKGDCADVSNSSFTSAESSCRVVNETEKENFTLKA